MIEDTIENEVNPKQLHKRKKIKEDEEQKKKLLVVDKWYEHRGYKVLEVFKKNNGNTYRVFSFDSRKFPEELLKLKNQGKLR